MLRVHREDLAARAGVLASLAVPQRHAERVPLAGLELRVVGEGPVGVGLGVGVTVAVGVPAIVGGSPGVGDRVGGAVWVAVAVDRRGGAKAALCSWQSMHGESKCARPVPSAR